jgi:hypothetical protein
MKPEVMGRTDVGYARQIVDQAGICCTGGGYDSEQTGVALGVDGLGER